MPLSALSPAFYLQTPQVVARELLGAQLCRRREDGAVCRLVINETEAYDGTEDRACHASKGRTRRTEVMFGPPGVWYVYLCYGVHWLANIVTGPVGYPAAVLLRGAGDFDGPGKLTKSLGVTGAQNGQPVALESGFWIEPGAPVPEDRVETTPRIGVGYAGAWADKPWRWVAQ